jgi:hypothetical protein
MKRTVPRQLGLFPVFVKLRFPKPRRPEPSGIPPGWKHPRIPPDRPIDEVERMAREGDQIAAAELAIRRAAAAGPGDLAELEA